MIKLRLLSFVFRPDFTILSLASHPQILCRVTFSRLAEVGKLETPKLDGKYDTGQLFLHRVFGYRGVTLFPWMARVYDRDGLNKEANRESEESSSGYNHVGKEVKSHTHTYYQVLIDSRDCPFVRTQTEAVTFLGNQDNSRSLYAIPGLDYVAHEDIIPYASTEKQPIAHELFDKFLMYDPDKDFRRKYPKLFKKMKDGFRRGRLLTRSHGGCIQISLASENDSQRASVSDFLSSIAYEYPPFSARETLRAWQEKNHPWLELSDVHKETTENIRVTVIPFYMGQRVSQNTGVYWWRYCIRLENLGELTVQLRERHWRIFSLSGSLETVRGRGVVGQEPILSKTQPAFQYSSHVSLQSPCGHMWGTFRMEREDGYNFECRIPPFGLESK